MSDTPSSGAAAQTVDAATQTAASGLLPSPNPPPLTLGSSAGSSPPAPSPTTGVSTAQFYPSSDIDVEEAYKLVPTPSDDEKNMYIPNTDSVLHLRETQTKLILCMVGLPARGKTYTAQKVARYLRWLGYNTKVFNVGEFRRRKFPQPQLDFFDPDNADAVAKRRGCAEDCLDSLLKFLANGGHAALFDATNSTEDRRKHVLSRIEARQYTFSVEVVWIESLCDINEIIEQNIRQTKLTSPEFAHAEDKEKAMDDFRQRIEHYRRAYETLKDSSGSWVKIRDMGRKVVAHRIFGYLPTRLVFYLMNLNSSRRVFYLTRHGQSLYNVQKRIGGDTGLSETGKKYSVCLAQYLQQQPEIQKLQSKGQPVRVWTSCLKRTLQTAVPTTQALNCDLVNWRALNEIDGGKMEHMTYEEIQETYPAEFAARAKDKLNYRYPGGESYKDLINRLEPVIFELERVNGPIVVVAHQAILRCVYAYFMGSETEKIPHLSIPLHTVIKITPKAYGVKEERIELITKPVN